MIDRNDATVTPDTANGEIAPARAVSSMDLESPVDRPAGEFELANAAGRSHTSRRPSRNALTAFLTGVALALGAACAFSYFRDALGAPSSSLDAPKGEGYRPAIRTMHGSEPVVLPPREMPAPQDTPALPASTPLVSSAPAATTAVAPSAPAAAPGQGNDSDLQSRLSSSLVVPIAQKSASRIDEKSPFKPMVAPLAVVPPDASLVIMEGKTLGAVLETAISSDLPGRVRAIVDEDIYGETGRNVLIPRMSRLVGEYQQATYLNQERLFINWRRVILPSGIGVDISSIGTDALGRSGLTGEIDRHMPLRFASAFLISIVNLQASNRSQSSSMLASGGSSGAGAADASGTAGLQVASSQAQSLLSAMAVTAPTIHAAHGSAVRVFVAKDLDFSKIRSLESASGELTAGTAAPAQR